MVAPEVLERIRSELLDSGRDTRYALDAYGFVLNGLEYCMTKAGEKRHVTGQELSRDLAEYAVKQFGPLAGDVLRRWGIAATDDFGNLVYNMIHIKVMSRREEDRLEDFFGVFDLASYFAGQEYFRIDKEQVRGVRGA
jgi:uncharacterized repeat protein (TIGR04138 family)